MPNPTLSEALAEAYASAPTDVVILHTLELRHIAFTQPIRVVHAHGNLRARLEPLAPANPGEEVEFIALAFDFQLPEVSDVGAPELVVQMDNVSAETVRQLKRTQGSRDPIYITYRPYLSTDLTAPHMDPVWHLVVTDISADVMRVNARATFGELINRQFPAETYTVERFPGLQT